MANPKRRHSNQRTKKRRTNDKRKLRMSQFQLGKCSQCGAFKRPHTVCAECGHYAKDKKVLEAKK